MQAYILESRFWSVLAPKICQSTDVLEFLALTAVAAASRHEQEKPILPALNLILSASRGDVQTDLGAPTAGVVSIESGVERGGGLRSHGSKCEDLETDGLQTSYIRCEVRNLKVVSVCPKLRRRLEHSLMYRVENQAMNCVCVCVCVLARVHARVRACTHARMYSVQIYVKMCQFTVTACNVNTCALTFCLF